MTLRIYKYYNIDTYFDLHASNFKLINTPTDIDNDNYGR